MLEAGYCRQEHELDTSLKRDAFVYSANYRHSAIQNYKVVVVPRLVCLLLHLSSSGNTLLTIRISGFKRSITIRNRYCYRLNVCVSPQFICQNLTLKGMVLGGGASER